VATATLRAVRSTRTRDLLIALTVALLLGYGLFSAQRARSATLAKKVFAGVRGSTVTLVNQSHVIALGHPATGVFDITFDRHVDNCSIIAGATEEGQIISSFQPTFQTSSRLRSRLRGLAAVDGPGAITEIRNAAVHPKRGGSFLRRHGQLDGANLAIRYLELLILRALEYEGFLYNRATQGGWELELVPWAH
jgi:hypothetical protein